MPSNSCVNTQQYKQPLLGNSSVARLFPPETRERAVMEEMFSVRSVQQL
jgi:hypothetical protein